MEPVVVCAPSRTMYAHSKIQSREIFLDTILPLSFLQLPRHEVISQRRRERSTVTLTRVVLSSGVPLPANSSTQFHREFLFRSTSEQSVRAQRGVPAKYFSPGCTENRSDCGPLRRCAARFVRCNYVPPFRPASLRNADWA